MLRDQLKGGVSCRAASGFHILFVIMVLGAWVALGLTAGNTPIMANPGGSDPDSAPDFEGLTVEGIYGEPSLYGDLPSRIRWLGNSKGISYLETRGEGDEEQTLFIIRDVPSGRERVICIPDTVTIPEDLRDSDDDVFSFGSYAWSEKDERIVFTYGGELFTMDRKKARITRRTMTEANEENATFSPDGKKLAYTRENDLYVLDLDNGEEVRLTTTGSDSLLNGVLDYVYMEELFTRGDVKGFCWSPDSKRLAFLQFDQSPVPEFPLVDWIPVDATHRLQRYPKAGDPNSIVRVGLVSALGGDITWTDTDTSDDSYLARLYWLGDSRGVAIEKLNRDQDHLTLLFADAETGRTSVVFEEAHRTWINITYMKHYYERRRQFVWESERSGHSHLYMYNLDGSLIRQITYGDWEVTALNGVDESKHKVYFTANKKNLMERHLYEVSDKGGEVKQVTQREGTHYVTISPNHKYYIDRFSNETRPTVVSVHSIKGKKLFEVGDQLSSSLASIKWPKPEFLTFKSGAGLEYYCAITKPSNFNRLEKYPVIVYTYGGPHAQVVRKSWSSRHLFHALMAEKGYIVFSLDNRGSYGRGRDWEDHVYKNLGRYELEDQLAGVEYLRTLPYVDGARIGIWGWSYGGYMTLMALFKAPDAFKAGVAVAPGTDWYLYDTIYTERYMKLPQDNEEGYKDSAPINFVDDFKGKLLLMYGDADDNVHAQNSVKLIQKLIKAGKDFDLMVFPKKRHSIKGDEERAFLYHKMANFFDEHLLHADNAD
jgi:dipeptidyl-peptidase-4